MKTIKKGKNKKGFTLIELITVVAILLILAIILIPNVLGYVNKSKVSKLKSDAKVILDVIKTVQSEKDDNSIDTYAKAVDPTAGDNNIKPTPEPSAALQGLNETNLEEIINDKNTDYDHYSTTYLKTSDKSGNNN